MEETLTDLLKSGNWDGRVETWGAPTVQIKLKNVDILIKKSHLLREHKINNINLTRTYVTIRSFILTGRPRLHIKLPSTHKRTKMYHHPCVPNSRATAYRRTLLLQSIVQLPLIERKWSKLISYEWAYIAFQ